MAFGALGAGLASSFAAKARQKDAAAAQLHLFKRRHQFETEDLEKAGLNRILGFARGSAPGVSPVSAPAINFPAPDILGVPKKLAGAKVAGRLAAAAATTAEHGAKEAKFHALTAENITDRSGEEANMASAHRLTAWDEQHKSHASLVRDVQRNMTEGKFEASDWGKRLRKWAYGGGQAFGPVKPAVGVLLGRTPKVGKVRHGNEPRRR